MNSITNFSPERAEYKCDRVEHSGNVYKKNKRKQTDGLKIQIRLMKVK